jgi:hypothetical protein
VLYSLSSRIYPVCFLLLMTACGGGGGSSSSGRGDPSSGGNPIEIPQDNAIPLEYSGSNDQAVITNQNIAALIHNFLGESATGSGPIRRGETSSVVALSKDSPINAYRLILGKRYSQSIYTSNQKNGSASGMNKTDQQEVAAVSRYLEECESGNIQHSADLNANGTGKIVMDYNHCFDGETTTDGMMTLTIYTYDQDDRIVTSGQFKFNRLVTIHNDNSVIDSGTIDITASITNNLEQYTYNIVSIDESTGKNIKINFNEELKYKNLQDLRNMAPYSTTINGQVYDSDYGYIDVETIIPLIQNAGLLSPSYYAGQLALSGAAGTKAWLTILWQSMVMVELDTDANGTYDGSAYLNLTRLLANENYDTTDTDGDGMHDSWEIQYSLNPHDSNDADQDNDNDQITNLNEYQRGTSPLLSGSKPPISDLELTLLPDSTQAFPVGHDATFNYQLHNNGPDDAEYISISIHIPGEFEYVSHWPVEECVIQDNWFVCRFDNIPSAYNRRFGVTFTLSSQLGAFELDHEIDAYSVDIQPDNNILNQLVETRPATAELSVNLTDIKDPVATGNYYNYKVEISNSGALPATPYSYTLTLPENTTVSYLSYQCEQAAGTISCTYPYELKPNQTASYTLQALTFAAAGSLLNSSVSVSSDVAELDMSDNTDSETTNVIEPTAGVSVGTFGDWKAVLVDTSFVWSISPRVQGPDYLDEIQLAVMLPDEIELLEIDANYADCTGTSNVVCTMDPRTYSYPSVSLMLTSSVPGIHEIQFDVSHSGIDPDLSNNSVTAPLYVGSPFNFIREQINTAPDGATVTVPPGYYFGDLRYSDKSINLVSSGGPEVTIISGLFYGFRPGPNGEISGFTFTHSRGPAIDLWDNLNIKISNNVFESLSMGFVAAIQVRNQSSAIIEKNIIRYNNCGNPWRGAITIENEMTSVIQNNVFYSNGCAAIYIPGYYSPAIVASNNTFVNNEAALVISEGGRGTGSYLGNNIIYGNDIGIETVTDCGASCDVLQSNLFFNNGTDFVDTQDQIGLNGNISADPLFVDPENSDYRLSIGSPAIDTGDATYAPVDDLLGNPRPVDGDGSSTAEPDIGAYEYQ